jgi:L-ribulokinase
MLVAGSPQTPALGSAISAAVAAGAHASFEAAQESMTTLKETRYTPNPAARRVYDELYGIYRELHDVFGGVPGARADFPSLMKRLLAIREREAAA